MKDKALLDILGAFLGKRVLIVGDIMLDEYIWGEVRRVSPEAPVPVVNLQRRTYLLGGAANAASNMVSLGGQVILGGTVGEDTQAAIFRETLSSCGIKEYMLFTEPSRPTTTKTRIIAHTQQVVRVDSEEDKPLLLETEEALLGWVGKHIRKADALLLSDYAKGVVTPRLAKETIRAAYQAGKPIIVDPKGTNYQKYRGATVLSPNAQEARLALSHLTNPPEELTEVGHHFLTLLERSAILITQGSSGMTLFQPNKELVHIPAITRKVYDVTGAGDTVVATLTLALAVGADLEQAARLANIAAGIVVSKVGTATVSLEELRQGVTRLEQATVE